MMKELTEQQYDSMRIDATVMAADEHGDKVLLLSDGRYLKLFRIKRLFTSARLFPYWRRFQSNAGKLEQLGIPTLKVIEAFRIPHLDRTGVHYDALPGSNLRESGELGASDMEVLGKFINTLHDKGVYLRSMHLGNVVKTPPGALGLIDIADMKIYGGSLRQGLRVRNFRHLCRYEQDRKVVASHIEIFLAQFEPTLAAKLEPLFAS